MTTCNYWKQAWHTIRTVKSLKSLSSPICFWKSVERRNSVVLALTSGLMTHRQQTASVAELSWCSLMSIFYSRTQWHFAKHRLLTILTWSLISHVRAQTEVRSTWINVSVSGKASKPLLKWSRCTSWHCLRELWLLSSCSWCSKSPSHAINRNLFTHLSSSQKHVEAFTLLLSVHHCLK